MRMPSVESEASFDTDAIGSPESSFDPDDSELPAVKSELAELKLQLLQKQQEVDAQKLEIEALKLQKQILQGEHNIAICELQQQLRLGFVEKIQQIMALYAAV